MDFRRIHPEPAATLTEQEAAAELRTAAAPPPDRPYLALNMVATGDGRITIGGRSGAIGNQHDRALFHELRAQVDAVMVGAGTARNERYGRMIKDPGLRARREQAGLNPDPLAVIVSARCALEPDLPLLQDPDSRVVVVTSSDVVIPDVRAQVDYIRIPADDAGVVPVAPALERLRDQGIGTVLCEGGPVLNGTLLQDGLVDELFLAVASKLSAGAGPSVVSGPALDPPRAMQLVSVLEGGGDLFLRYRITR